MLLACTEFAICPSIMQLVVNSFGDCINKKPGKSTAGAAVYACHSPWRCPRVTLATWRLATRFRVRHAPYMLTGTLIPVLRPSRFAGTSPLQLALLKVALLLGVKFQVGKEHAFKSLAQADNYHVLILATSFRPNLLQTISAEAGDSTTGKLRHSLLCGQFVQTHRCTEAARTGNSLVCRS